MPPKSKSPHFYTEGDPRGGITEEDAIALAIARMRPEYIAVDVELYDVAKRIAKSEGRELTEIVEKSLRRYLSSAHKRAQRRMLATPDSAELVGAADKARFTARRPKISGLFRKKKRGYSAPVDPDNTLDQFFTSVEPEPVTPIDNNEPEPKE